MDDDTSLQLLSSAAASADKQECFFVGDAGGRPGDFADSDKCAVPSFNICASTCCTQEGYGPLQLRRASGHVLPGLHDFQLKCPDIVAAYRYQAC